MSWKLRPRARNNNYGSTGCGTLVLVFICLICLFIWPVQVLSLGGFLGIIAYLNNWMKESYGEPDIKLDDEDDFSSVTRYGIKGGRYEMRISKKIGKLYRHYF